MQFSSLTLNFHPQAALFGLIEHDLEGKTSSGLPLPWPLHAPAHSSNKTFPSLPRKHDAQSANLGHARCTNSLRAAGAFPIFLQLIQAAYTAPYSDLFLHMLVSDHLRNDHLNLLIPDYTICIELLQMPKNMDYESPLPNPGAPVPPPGNNFQKLFPGGVDLCYISRL